MRPASNVSTFICFYLSALLVCYHLVFRSTSSIDSWITGSPTDTFSFAIPPISGSVFHSHLDLLLAAVDFVPFHPPICLCPVHTGISARIRTVFATSARPKHPLFFSVCTFELVYFLWLLVIMHTANNSRSGERAETRNRGPSLARSPPCGTAYDADCAEDASLDASAPQPPRCPCTAAPCGDIGVDAAKLDASASSPQTRLSLARTTAALARSESLAQSASGRMARSGRGEGGHEALLVRHGSQVASAAATATAGHR